MNVFGLEIVLPETQEIVSRFDVNLDTISDFFNTNKMLSSFDYYLFKDRVLIAVRRDRKREDGSFICTIEVTKHGVEVLDNLDY